jgi:hypothetical protein
LRSFFARVRHRLPHYTATKKTLNKRCKNSLDKTTIVGGAASGWNYFKNARFFMEFITKKVAITARKRYNQKKELGERPLSKLQHNEGAALCVLTSSIRLS